MKEPRYEKQPAFVIITWFAVCVATYLVWHHIAFRSGYQQGNSLCSINQFFDCGKIERSRYSELLGIPVASFALLFYLMFAAFVSLAKRRSGMTETTFAAVVLLASTISLVTSLHFAVISLVRIRAVCLFCSMLYLSSLVLFAMALRLSANRSRFLTQLKTGASLLIRYFLPFTPITSAVGNLGRLRVLSLLSVTCLAALIYIVPPSVESKILIPKVKQFMASDEAQAALKMWLATPVKEISIVKEPIEDRDFSLGPENAPITLVEFSDFECPHCQLSAPRVHALLERYPTAVRVVFKHYPLDASCNRHLPRKLHEFACRAAAMNRCAGIQNPELFFPMADALFALGSDFSDESLGMAAQEVGVNLDQFALCLNNVATMDRIKKDIEEASQLGLQSTPTFFANGRLVSGQAMEVLPIIIEHVLAEQKKQTN